MFYELVVSGVCWGRTKDFGGRRRRAGRARPKATGRASERTRAREAAQVAGSAAVSV